ncbi:MAG: hypothetical protein DRQ99_19560 [Candidatus Parabeggiatoa sp. nov. 3]|nr:MAG: hypothetical protein DRQ99_19560 [Gammaproteobacteria bacterium]
MKFNFQHVIKKMARIYVNTPFYPHWHEFRQSERLTHSISKELASDLGDKASLSLLEIGCSSQTNRTRLSKYLPISYYCGLEYPTWWISNTSATNFWATQSSQKDSSENKSKVLHFGGGVRNIIFGNPTLKVDVWGNGLELPFSDGCFDIVAHFEVMEHVSSPEVLFQEIARCLKQDGYLLFSVPFIYQNHSGIDISRLTQQGVEALAQKQGLEKVNYLSTGFGTALSQLSNSFIIKQVVKFHDDSCSTARKIITAVLATMFLFPVINVMGLIIDKIWFDSAYANRHFFLYKKNPLFKGKQNR